MAAAKFRFQSANPVWELMDMDLRAQEPQIQDKLRDALQKTRQLHPVLAWFAPGSFYELVPPIPASFVRLARFFTHTLPWWLFRFGAWLWENR